MSGLFDAAIDSLTHLIAGSDQRQGCVQTKASPMAFDGFDLFTTLSDKDADDFVLTGAAHQPPIWPMDACWAIYNPGNQKNVFGQTLEQGWAFKRICTLNLKHWRGKLRITLPKMVERHEFFTDQSGQSISSVLPLGLTNRGIAFCGTKSHSAAGWGRIDPTQGFSPGKGDFDLSVEALDLSVAHGFMLRREYLWSVLLGEPGIPRARFVTDVIGVRETFRLRETPSGKPRRAALRHWVREHWRKNRSLGGDDKAWVRAHLRGQLNFFWNGLSCQIVPSQADARRNQEMVA
jgi:hypothetical protein